MAQLLDIIFSLESITWDFYGTDGKIKNNLSELRNKIKLSWKGVAASYYNCLLLTPSWD